MKVLVAIPVRNGRDYIKKLVEDVKNACPGFDIMVVDDCSDDDTVLIAHESGAKVMSMPVSLSAGDPVQAAVRIRYREGFDALVWFPPEFAQRSAEIPILAEKLRGGADLAVASGGGQTGDFLISLVPLLFYGKYIKNISCPFRAYSRRCFENLCGRDEFSFGTDAVYVAREGGNFAFVSRTEKPRKKSITENISGFLSSVVGFFRAFLCALGCVNRKKAAFVLPALAVSYFGVLAYAASQWYVNSFGRVGFNAILATLGGGMQGVPKDDILIFIFRVFLPTLLGFGLAVRLVQKLCKKLGEKNSGFLKFKKVSLIPFMAVSLCLTVLAGQEVEMWEYLKYTNSNSTLYEDYYVDPGSVSVTFPEKKRNLIYIFMESMESTYMEKEKGGQLDYDITKNLYRLADENINFSTGSGYGGFYEAYGATWTIGAMVSQTAGVPLMALPDHGPNNLGELSQFLPGLRTMSDILADNGYYQAFMCGSDAAFAGRDKYFSQHGVDKIYDLYTAYDDGIVPEDYRVFWGFEDLHLYDYAKQELTKMARQDRPFAFTLLTVDTHHNEGYLCDKCTDEYGQQYENVLACADRQIMDFVDWLKEQDFYRDTTVVIVGDHLFMGHFDGLPDEEYRRVYNCFINSAVSTDNTKNRGVITMDMFPTVLAAMGADIEGDRLGFGTNLFSDSETLREKFGWEDFYLMLMGGKDYYLENFHRL